MADADLTQFNRVAADAEAANAADALTSQLLLITDGKKITGETNSSGKAPVNRGTKALALMIAGLRGALFGNVTGIAKRSLKSLLVDGTGGATHTTPDGCIRAAAVYGGATTPQTAVQQGTITKDSPVFGFGSVYWSGVAYSLDGGFNVYGITQPGGAGSVVVTLASAAPVGTSCVIVVTSYRNGGSARMFEIVSAPVNAASKLTFTVNMYDAAGMLADSGFSFVAHCAAA